MKKMLSFIMVVLITLSLITTKAYAGQYRLSNLSIKSDVYSIDLSFNCNSAFCVVYYRQDGLDNSYTQEIKVYQNYGDEYNVRLTGLNPGTRYKVTISAQSKEHVFSDYIYSESWQQHLGQTVIGYVEGLGQALQNACTFAWNLATDPWNTISDACKSLGNGIVLVYDGVVYAFQNPEDAKAILGDAWDDYCYNFDARKNGQLFGNVAGDTCVAIGTYEGGKWIFNNVFSKAAQVNVLVDIRKFTEYIFKDGVAQGKATIFKNLGYDINDSEILLDIYKKQASIKYAKGEYTLGKADTFGQRINIEIQLQGIGKFKGKNSYLKSGWIIKNDGSVSLTTPFAGFTK